MREIVIDTETTGLDYKTGDRIIEVGCVELKNYVPTGNTLQFYCKPDRSISEGAKNIVGLSDDFLNQQKPFKENHKELLNFLKNNTLIIHNDKVVVDSPSIVAIDKKTEKIIAVGTEASLMQGKTHENIKTVRP